MGEGGGRGAAKGVSPAVTKQSSTGEEETNPEDLASTIRGGGTVVAAGVI